MKRIIDWEDLMNRLGDEDIIKEIVPEFLNSNVDFMDALSNAIEHNDSCGVEHHAHTLKGASASIGAVDLAKSAKILELMAKDVSLGNAETALATIRKEYDDVVALLNKPNWPEIAKNSSQATL